MKKKLLMLSAAAICIAILAAGTLAFFTAEGTAHNVITTGGVDIKLYEWGNDEKTEPFEDIEGLLPGMEVTKIAEVKNTGGAEAWIRVRVTKDIALQGDGEADPDMVSLNLNKEFWAQGDDGYIYYTRTLKPGETTEPVFTTVRCRYGQRVPGRESHCGCAGPGCADCQQRHVCQRRPGLARGKSLRRLRYA